MKFLQKFKSMTPSVINSETDRKDKLKFGTSKNYKVYKSRFRAESILKLKLLCTSCVLDQKLL